MTTPNYKKVTFSFLVDLNDAEDVQKARTILRDLYVQAPRDLRKANLPAMLEAYSDLATEQDFRTWAEE